MLCSCKHSKQFGNCSIISTSSSSPTRRNGMWCTQHHWIGITIRASSLLRITSRIDVEQFWESARNFGLERSMTPTLLTKYWQKSIFWRALSWVSGEYLNVTINPIWVSGHGVWKTYISVTTSNAIKIDIDIWPCRLAWYHVESPSMSKLYCQENR